MTAENQTIATRRRGRPVTSRSREAFMIAVWRAVQREIHVFGARSVRHACERIFNLCARGEIRFVDQDQRTVTLISGDGGAAKLRQFYQTAERCRHRADKYPALHAVAARLERDLPGTRARTKAHAQQHRDWLAAGADALADISYH